MKIPVQKILVFIALSVVGLSRINAQTPIAYYPFSGDVTDASGNGNDGVNLGATLTTDKDGNPNSAYYFDGSTSRITLLASNTAINAAKPRTIAFWANVPSQGTLKPFFAMGGQSACNKEFGLMSDGYGQLWLSGSCDLVNTFTGHYGAWHLYAMTYDGTTVSIYKDGCLSNSGTRALVTGTTSLDLGYWTYNGNRLIGSIDEVRIYNVALTGNQILAAYGVPTIISTIPGFICNTGSVTLGATASSGTIDWYAAASGGTSLGTGTSFSTPVISASTTYYAEATGNSCRTPVIATVYPTTFISTTPVTICDVGTGTITATPNAGTVKWYSVLTGGTSIATGNSYTTPSLSSTTTYYAEVTNNSCISPIRTGVNANVYTTPTITGTTPNSRCGTGTVLLGASSDVGVISWYSALTGGASLGSGTSYTTPSISTSTHRYVSANNGGCISTPRVDVLATVYSIPTITSTTPSSICDGGVITLGANPSAGNVNWYSASTGGVSLNTGNSFATPSLSSTTSYYVDAADINCTTASRTAIIATVYSTTFSSTTPASRCDAGTLTLSAVPTAGVVNWYSASTGGVSLFTGTSYTTPSISATTTYYAEVTNNGCVSPARTAVVATVTITPGIGSTTPASRCDAGTVVLGATSATGAVNWFSALTGGASLLTGTSYTTPSISTTKTYYVSATLNGCTSTPRTAVIATVTTTPSIGSTTPASRCDAGTVVLGATSATGAVDWYNASTGGASLFTGTSYSTPSISTTTTYYVEASLNGCTSTPRIAVIATVTATPNIGSTTPNSRCNTGTLGLGATSATGTVKWYSASTGGASLFTGTSYTTPSISTTTTYYVDATLNGCISAPRTAVIATVTITPSIGSTTPASRCDAGTVVLGATSATGAVDWYSASTGGASLFTGTSYTTPSISTTTTYYVEASLNGCISAPRTAVIATVTATPNIGSTTPNSRCNTGTLGLGATSATGTVNWYAATTGGTSLFTGTSYTTPSISATTTYYVDATLNGCISAPRTAVIATVTITPSIGSTTPANRCDAGTVVLGATSATGAVDWYSASTGGASLFTGTSYTTPSISSTSTYYVSATLNGCTSTPRTAVIATVTSTPSIGSTTPASRCNTGTMVLGATSATGTVNWYSASTGGASLFTGTSYTTPSISATTTYYVDATLNGCISAPRTAVIATVTLTPSIGSTTPANRCDAGTVVLGATSATGTVNWYSASTGGASLFTGTSYTTPSISTTTTYYTDANLNGCISAPRTAVIATVTVTPSIGSTTPASRCNTGILVLGATSATGTVNWYSASTGGASLFTGTSYTTSSISSTTTYYVDAILNGCTSTPRTAVIATVTTTPSIGGTTPNSRCNNGILSLGATSATGTVNWYSASTGGTNLVTGTSYTTPSISSTTTYYTDATLNGCTSSPRTAVIATVNLSPTFSLFSSTNTTVCGGADGTFTLNGLNASTSYTLNYNGGSSLGILTDGTGKYLKTGLPAGSYTNFTITDVNTCSFVNSSTATIVDPGAPSVDAGSSDTVCQGDQVLLSAVNPNGASIVWDNGVIDNVAFAASTTTTYTVTANLAGCIATDQVIITVKNNQTITFNPLASIDIAATLILNATSSAGLPIQYSSSNNSILTFTNNIPTMVAPGNVIITASQPGNNCFNAASAVAQPLQITGKLNQSITINTIPSVNFGTPITITATSSAGVAYPVLVVSSDPSIALISGGKLIALKNGTITLTASQAGDVSYNAAPDVIQTVKVIVPPFTIVGKSKVDEYNVEDYYISPVFPNLTYAWSYSQSDILYLSGQVSTAFTVFYKKTTPDGILTCTLTDPISGVGIPVTKEVTVFHSINKGLQPIQCDSIQSTFEACSGNYINGFSLNNISNPLSGCSSTGIQDFTIDAYVGELFLGESYNATVNIGTNPVAVKSNNYVGVWLDYNSNASFEDAGEFLLSTYSPDSIIALNNIIISTNNEYADKELRLRLRVRSSGLFTQSEYCLDFNESGETEDYKVKLKAPDRLEAPVLISPNEDGKNDFFVIKGISTFDKSTNTRVSNKLTILDRGGNVLFVKDNYDNTWDGKDKDSKLLPRDTYYYNFVNGDAVIRGYFEIRYE